MNTITIPLYPVYNKYAERAFPQSEISYSSLSFSYYIQTLQIFFFIADFPHFARSCVPSVGSLVLSILLTPHTIHYPLSTILDTIKWWEVLQPWSWQVVGEGTITSRVDEHSQLLNSHCNHMVRSCSKQHLDLGSGLQHGTDDLNDIHTTTPHTKKTA